MRRYLKTLDAMENFIMVISMIIMLVITFLNVVIRKFTTTSFAFTEEIVAPLFILLSLVGAGALARRGGHIGLSALTDLIPKKYQKYISLFTAIVSVFFSVLLIVYGFNMTMAEMQQKMMTPALQWPEWIFGSFVPIGGLFMTLEFINFGILAFFDFREDKGEKAEKAGAVDDIEEGAII